MDWIIIMNRIKLPDRLPGAHGANRFLHGPAQTPAGAGGMKARHLIAVLFSTLVAGIHCAQAAPLDPNMEAFVSGLLGKMTLEEKIGQLNLLSTGFDLTGPVASQDVEESVRKGLGGETRKMHK